MAAHTCNSSTQERQEDCEFEASLDYVTRFCDLRILQGLEIASQSRGVS